MATLQADVRSVHEIFNNTKPGLGRVTKGLLFDPSGKDESGTLMGPKG